MPASTDGRAFRASLRVASLSVLLALFGCGKSEGSKVMDAIKARFPSGQTRCLGISGDAVGIHVPRPADGITFFPGTGWTSPLAHPFVFYAGAAGDPAPELAAMLAGEGVLRRVVVEGTTDVATSGIGPLVLTKAGNHSHPGWVRHVRTPAKIAIYLTERYDPRFSYELHSIQRNGSLLDAFQSRVFDGPLPPPDQAYRLQMVTPYAMSVVSQACAPETPTRVVSAERTRLWDGTPVVQADVDYVSTAPAWMTTPTFTRAALGYQNASFSQTRRATIMFAIKGESLSYVEEKRP